MVHTSGALGADVLEPAMAAGTQIGSFHPLVAFADIELAVAALDGATVAIEGDDQLAGPVGLDGRGHRCLPGPAWPRGRSPAYHAAAVLAAGGFIALLDAIAELGAVAGLDEAGSLAIYGRLAQSDRSRARALGIPRALTGPMTRGDVGTLDRHLATLSAHAPDVLPLYLAAAGRESPGRVAWRPRTGGCRCDASFRLRPKADALPYGRWSTASPRSTQRARRAVSPTLRARPRRRRLGLCSAIAFRATRAWHTVLRREPSSLALLRGGSRAITPAAPGRRRLRQTSPDRIDDLVTLRAHRLIERRHGAVARLRTATATSAGGIVYLRGWPPVPRDRF